ncbi:N-6 DNA methylase [Clostridium sp. Sa3CVN1]|uniref:site-specific DNA-methyltransferase (adenine-specific) n=2 Tax=Clostridium cibarium TaxID=2762247 RepID=A0ABR8PY21_9CLOT|nr:N-6 DNA methylase [Clostridium cibarium]
MIKVTFFSKYHFQNATFSQNYLYQRLHQDFHLTLMIYNFDDIGIEANDGTSIVNGQIFHAAKDVKIGHYIEEDSHAVCFEQIILEFASYEKKNGKFINISKDFKSKLFETFMKNSDDKADMGQFFTPLKIVEEMVSMVNIFDGAKICDPAAGVGKFLLESVANSSVDYEIKRKSDGTPEELTAGLELFGFEKQMSGNDDITTILSKANMLIYFSKLFKENNDSESVMFLANKLMNKTFLSSKTALGTLGRNDKNEYDLILANPPYYTDATISSLARNTGFYPSNGKGVEGLFLEWIINALKFGETANIILPEGIFTNIGNKGLKELIIRSCYIESIISLPINSFFNTPKKTYIFTLRKKTKSESESGVVQNYKVFTYICKSIGETLDVYRFDIDDNDLHEATNKYNAYRNLSDKNDIQEPFKSWFESDKKMKLQDISIFDPNTNWNIDNYWSDEEKIELGFKEADSVMSLSEFQLFIDEIVEEVGNYKEAIECLKK